MPRRYRFFTALTAIGGSIALVITGKLNPIFYPFILLSLSGYWRLLRGASQAPRIVIGISSIAGLFIFLFDAFIISGDYLMGVAHLSLIFHAIKSFDIKDPYDPLQVYFMTLLQLVVASEFTTAMLFGVVIIVFIILFIIAMNMAHYIKIKAIGNEVTVRLSSEMRSILFLVLSTVVMSVIFFISLPRLPYGLWGKSHVRGIKNAGFSERMDLKEGELKLDPTIVARIELRPFIKGPYYWRGIVLNYFDGNEWSNTFRNLKESIIKRVSAENSAGEFIINQPQPQKNKSQTSDSKTIVEADVLLEPIESDVIFIPDLWQGKNWSLSIITSAIKIEKDSSGSIYIPRKGARRLHYLVRIKDKDISIPHQLQNIDKNIYLQIPTELKKVLMDFNKKIFKENGLNSNLQKAKEIESYLKKNYRYSLKVSEPPSGVDPVSYFLFYSKSGYCEHYASAMVLMLRAEGIPARIVTGFAGGEVNPVGNYIILRQKDAHSWIEAWIYGRWLRFDPTPSISLAQDRPSILFLYIDYLKLKWQRYVVNFTRRDQLSIFQRVLDTIKETGISFSKGVYSIYKTILLIFKYIVITCLIVLSMIILIMLSRQIRINKHGLSPQKISSYYIRLRRFLNKKGYPVRDSTTSGEILKMAISSKAALNRNIEPLLKEFIMLYEKWRFGQPALRTLPERGEMTVDIRRLKELLRLLKESLKKR